MPSGRPPPASVAVPSQQQPEGKEKKKSNATSEQWETLAITNDDDSWGGVGGGQWVPLGHVGYWGPVSLLYSLADKATHSPRRGGFGSFAKSPLIPSPPIIIHLPRGASAPHALSLYPANPQFKSDQTLWTSI